MSMCQCHKQFSRVAKYYFCHFQNLSTTQCSNVTLAGKCSFLFHATLHWFNTENISIYMHLFPALQSVGEKQFYVKTSFYFPPPSHCWAITVHTTRQLPDSVTAQSIFRCMNKTFRHLSNRLLLYSVNEHTIRQGVFLLVWVEAPILSSLNYLLYIVAAARHPMMERLKDSWPRIYFF